MSGLNLILKINGRVEELLFELSLLVDETTKQRNTPISEILMFNLKEVGVLNSLL